MATVIISFILGGMVGLLIASVCVVAKDPSPSTGTSYCWNCGNAPGYEATAACYVCNNYNQWKPKQIKKVGND